MKMVVTDEGKKWEASYTLSGTGKAMRFEVQARSYLEIIVAQTDDYNQYYIAVPNFGVAIPGIGSLDEKFWIAEKLAGAGMPAPDAATVAFVLADFAKRLKEG